MGLASKLKRNSDNALSGPTPGHYPPPYSAFTPLAENPSAGPYPNTAQANTNRGADYKYPQTPSHAVLNYSYGPSNFSGQYPVQYPVQNAAMNTAMNANNQHILSQRLQGIITANKLQHFYPPHKFQAILSKVMQVDFAKLATEWKLSLELAYDLAALALYDIVFLCDDSGSMAFEEGGERIDDLKVILSRVASVATRFDDDGIVVRFMNSNVKGDGIRNAAEAEALIASISFTGGTPLGTQLDAKIIQPFIIGPARSATMEKPVMIFTITDGEPIGEPRNKVIDVLRNVKHYLDKTPYGRHAISMQVAQVGRDQRAQRFLGEIDNHRSVGTIIDCTSYYELEEVEWAAKGVQLTPELWLLKVCLGGIDPSYDDKD